MGSFRTTKCFVSKWELWQEKFFSIRGLIVTSIKRWLEGKVFLIYRLDCDFNQEMVDKGKGSFRTTKCFVSKWELWQGKFFTVRGLIRTSIKRWLTRESFSQLWAWLWPQSSLVTVYNTVLHKNTMFLENFISIGLIRNRLPTYLYRCL